MAKVYRIVKQTNGRGKVRWRVQRWWNALKVWEPEWSQHRTLKGAQRHLERLQKRDAGNTWTEEVVG